MPDSPAGPRRTDCTLRYEGQDVPAVRGEPVAVALAAAGHRVLSRSIKYHRPRSWFCLAGHCNACMMRVDGVPNVKACTTPVRDGLAVERQNGFPSGNFDVLGAADWFFPRGMDHHTLMTSSRTLNAVLRRVVREVGGLGRLPDEAGAAAAGDGGAPAAAEGDDENAVTTVDVAIVGGGAAGLSAAAACARAAPAGTAIAVFDEGERPGGSLRSHPGFGAARAEALAEEARALGVALHPRTAAIGWFPEDDGGVLALVEGGGAGGGTLRRLRARRYLYATGGYDVNALFSDNDRPGVCAARAVGTLLAHGVVPAKRPLVLGQGEYADALAAALTAAGATVSRVDGAEEKPVAARGASWVSGLLVERGGARRRIACDLVAVVEPPAPASELPRMHGARVELSAAGGGFGVLRDEAGQTAAARVYAAGDVCGYRGVAAALRDGQRVGQAIGESLAGGGAG